MWLSARCFEDSLRMDCLGGPERSVPSRVVHPVAPRGRRHIRPTGRVSRPPTLPAGASASLRCASGAVNIGVLPLQKYCCKQESWCVSDSDQSQFRFRDEKMQEGPQRMPEPSHGEPKSRGTTILGVMEHAYIFPRSEGGHTPYGALCGHSSVRRRSRSMARNMAS